YNTGSDHYMLLTEVTGCKRRRGRKPQTLLDDEYPERVEALLDPRADTEEDPEVIAKALLDALQGAIMEQPTSGRRTASWWTENAKEAHGRFKKDPSEANRKEWHKTIRKEKKKYW